MKRERNSNIELLRIAAMLLIIMHHFSVHTGYYYPSEIFCPNRYYMDLLSIGGKLGVDIFVIISGYYLSASDNFRWRKLAKIYLQMATYSLAIYFIYAYMWSTEVTAYSVMQAAMPITSDLWWFATAYFMLYLFSPFIVKGINSVDKKTLLQILAIMLLLWGLCNRLLNIDLYYNALGWFITMFILGAAIRRFSRGGGIFNDIFHNISRVCGSGVY